jgi:hypothetical protein
MVTPGAGGGGNDGAGAGGRGYGSGRGGGRTGGGGGAARGGRHGYGAGHGYGYNQEIDDGARYNGPRFNPNLGAHPPNFGPGWDYERGRRGRFGGNGGRGWNGGFRQGRNYQRQAPHRDQQRTSSFGLQQQQGTQYVPNQQPQPQLLNQQHQPQQQMQIQSQPQNAQQHTSREPPVVSAAHTGPTLEAQQVKGVEQQMTAGKGAACTEQVKTVKMQSSQVLQGCSSTAGASGQQVENLVIEAGSVGAVEVVQKTATSKICRRCGVKGHLMNECTVIVYCHICKSTDHAMCRCPIPKQPKPVAQLVGQAADVLAGFHIPFGPIQPTKKDSRMALVSTSGKNLTEEDVAAFLRVLVSDSFAWEVIRHSGSDFKVLFPTKADLTKMTRFNAEMKEGVTLKFQEFKEDEEYFGHALPVVWMRVKNLPTILREYVILWALGTLFGVTQEVDMVTTRVNNFGRFAVAVLEPKAIPTKLDVIIGNRYFQLLFEIEPFLPNIGLRNIWSTQINGSEDHGNGAAKDTEMREAQNNLENNIPDASAGIAEKNNMTGKEAKTKETQMDMDLSEDDLLGEENELSEAAHNFVGIKKGDAVNVRNASSLAPPVSLGSLSASRPLGLALMAQSKAPLEGNPSGLAQPKTTSQGSTLRGSTDQVLHYTEKGLPANITAAAVFSNSEEQVQVPAARFERTDDAAAIHREHLIGASLDAMIGAGVSADGGSEYELGSVTKMAVLSEGELTPVRRSKRNAEMADVHSLEKAEKRAAVKNLEITQGNKFTCTVCSFSDNRLEENLGRVGITLGNTKNLVATSVALIKDVEKERMKPSHLFNKVDVQNNLDFDSDFEEDEIDPDTSTVSRLCGDLTEEVMDDNIADLDGVLVDIPIKMAKNKKKKKLLNKNTTTRKKILF